MSGQYDSVEIQALLLRWPGALNRSPEQNCDVPEPAKSRFGCITETDVTPLLAKGHDAIRVVVVEVDLLRRQRRSAGCDTEDGSWIASIDHLGSENLAR